MSDKKLYEHLPETIEVMIDGKHHSLKGYKVWEPIEADGTFTGSCRFITHIGAKDWEQKSAIENDMTAHPKKYIPEIVTTHRVFCRGDIYVFPPKVTSAHYDAQNKQESERMSEELKSCPKCDNDVTLYFIEGLNRANPERIIATHYADMLESFHETPEAFTDFPVAIRCQNCGFELYLGKDIQETIDAWNTLERR